MRIGPTPRAWNCWVRRWTAAVPSPALAVPATLHASLMARLDRLGPAKELAQIGAAIGREFSHALLAAVMRKQAAEQLRRALDQIATLTPTSALRREEIKLQVALIHVSGYAAPETRAAVER